MHMYICIYICKYIHTYIDIHVFLYIYICACVCPCVTSNMHVCDLVPEGSSFVLKTAGCELLHSKTLNPKPLNP